MELFRLKLKVGAHEFEAEGEQETVERQFAMWRELIASPSAAPVVLASPPPIVRLPADTPAVVIESRPATVPIVSMPADMRESYDRLFHHAGRIVSLTVHPAGQQREADAALLLLLGQKVYNGEDLVTGSQILDGLKQSGIAVVRADRVFGQHMDTSVIRIGAHRAVKYRLTNPGMARARGIAEELLATVA